MTICRVAQCSGMGPPGRRLGGCSGSDEHSPIAAQEPIDGTRWRSPRAVTTGGPKRCSRRCKTDPGLE